MSEFAILAEFPKKALKSEKLTNAQGWVKMKCKFSNPIFIEGLVLRNGHFVAVLARP